MDEINVSLVYSPAVLLLQLSKDWQQLEFRLCIPQLIKWPMIERNCIVITTVLYICLGPESHVPSSI